MLRIMRRRCHGAVRSAIAGALFALSLPPHPYWPFPSLWLVDRRIVPHSRFVNTRQTPHSLSGALMRFSTYRSALCRALILAVMAAASLSLGSPFAPVSARAAEPKPIRALLIIGGCCHDYRAQMELLTKGVSARANVEWKVAYDSDTGTKHLNPWYEKEDWAKGFDVIVHDECCSDVKDLATVEKILKPHREGLPAVLLHCGMHSYRTEGYPNDTPWFRFTGLASTGHGPQAPIAVTYLQSDSPIITGLETGSRKTKSFTTIRRGNFSTRPGRWPAASRTGKGKTARRTRRPRYACGPIDTTKRQTSSPRPWVITTSRSETIATSIWLHEDCCGRSGSLTRPI